jgi:PAS domain S-box-containing protein
MSQGPELSVEELRQFVIRLMTKEPHVRCRVGEGPLAPLASVLNELAEWLEAQRLSSVEKFGIEALVEQSQTMMITGDTSERIRFINFTVPGDLPEQIPGRSIYDFVAPADRERVQGFLRAALERGETATYEIQSIYLGGPQWYVVKVGPIRDAGRIVGFTMITTDISNLKKTQLRLEQSLRELARSNRELEAFAAVASHDLQEPLRRVQTLAERLKAGAGPTLEPESQDYLERILSTTARMRRLIRDLLTYARVTSRAQPFVRVELGPLLREVLADLEVTIEQAGGRVTVGELPALQADPTQMRQLFQNLLSNALKFRREGVAPLISIEASVDEAARRVELRIQDNGIGFDESDREQIFSLFQRLHPVEKYDGSGLGLALCQKIAERHGGLLSARSSPGQGATFTVTLPLEASLTASAG